MLTMFSDADFRWSNGLLIRCIHVNLRQFFQIPRRAFIFKRTLSVRLDLHITIPHVRDQINLLKLQN